MLNINSLAFLHIRTPKSHSINCFVLSILIANNYSRMSNDGLFALTNIPQVIISFSQNSLNTTLYLSKLYILCNRYIYAFICLFHFCTRVFVHFCTLFHLSPLFPKSVSPFLFLSLSLSSFPRDCHSMISFASEIKGNTRVEG